MKNEEEIPDNVILGEDEVEPDRYSLVSIRYVAMPDGKMSMVLRELEVTSFLPPRLIKAAILREEERQLRLIRAREISPEDKLLEKIAGLMRLAWIDDEVDEMDGFPTIIENLNFLRESGKISRRTYFRWKRILADRITEQAVDEIAAELEESED